MTVIKNILLDLDGTLTDPKEGITKSIQYALTKLNVLPPSMDELEWAIGPPISQIFSLLLKTDDPNKIKEGVAFYRERYEGACHVENKPYEGIHLTLQNLTQNGFKLYLATSKLQEYAHKILKHFNLADFFEVIYGSRLDGTWDDKETLIDHILTTNELKRSESLMIGDRYYDIQGAKLNKIKSIGVTYGYGSLAEIQTAEPDAICHEHLTILNTILTL